ncbi:MAG: ATP-binding cassette domain-containing protein, partial [Pseudoclavibacter sp.]
IIGEGRASPAVRRGRLSPTVALIADEADAAGSGVARSAPDAGADPAAHPPTLAARGVTIRRGGRALLDDAAFEVGAGELVAVRGPSGSGKTSLARAVGGLAPPVAGELRLGDRALPWDARERARASAPFVAYLGQDAVAALNPGETVDRALRRALATAARRGRELDLSLGLGGDGDGDGDGDGGRDSTAARLLRLVGLDPGLLDRTPDRLSGGQRHRVVLARAVAAAPAALVCDETTAALDHAAGERMLDTIDRLRRDAGMPVLFVTHQSAVTDRADRVLTLEKGHLR